MADLKLKNKFKYTLKPRTFKALFLNQRMINMEAYGGRLTLITQLRV